jgi:hypothetical protein
MAGSTEAIYLKIKKMKNLISNKKYVLPLLALPFVFLFVYVGAQFMKEDKPKEKPKELSLSLVKRRILL